MAGYFGDCGTDEDGVWRSSDTLPGRGRPRLREGTPGAAPRVVVLEWADQRLSREEWARVD